MPHEYLTPAQLRAVQCKSFDIFLDLVAFCREHRITVFLDSGNLLGAVRTGEFIPWDDDVDVAMPRPDFERFVKLWQKYGDAARYTYLRTDETTVTGDPQPQLIDNTTTCIMANHVHLDIAQGLGIDIFPLDGCPDSRLGRAAQVLWALLYSLFNAQFVPTNHGTAARLGSRLLLGLVRRPATRYRIWRYAERRMAATPFGSTQWARYLYSGLATMRKVFFAADFMDTVTLTFEGHPVPAPVGYDRYLTIYYGDYMTPPPPDQRRPHHDIAFLDLDTPYAAYRGTKYAVAPQS